MEGQGKNFERDIGRLLGKIDKWKGMPEENKKAIKSWVDFQRARGINARTITKNLYCMVSFLYCIPAKTSLSKATKDDIASAIAKIESSEYSSTTKRNIKITVKSFYKHFLGEDVSYPKQIAWIRSATNRNKKMLPEDILGEEEILKMISAAGNLRDKAIIAVLYDSGIRVGELLSLRAKDLELNDELAHITVNGKTGMRKVPIAFSAPYLARYLELVKEKKPNDYLWTGIGTWSSANKLVDDSAIRKLLRQYAAKAGIDKRIYPHLFRHSRATYYANKLTEQQLKHFFGWAGDSKMVSTYVHMSGRDIDDAILQINGKKPKEVMAPKLTEKICPKCREPNGIDSLHCSRCGSALELATALKEQEMREDIEEMGVKKIRNEDFKADIARNLKGKKKSDTRL
jgi:site-specific recombinase XerD